MKKTDVLIIGSGISSLTSALLLAKRGKSVVVLEAHTKPGGYLHCFNRFGVQYDTGAHYVGAMDPGQPFHTLLNYLGVYDDSLFIPLDPDGFDVFNFPEFSISFPKGYAEFARTLCAQFPNEKEAIRKYLELTQKTVQHFPTYEFNEHSIDEIPAKEIFGTSLREVVEALTANKHLQCVLYGYCALHGVQPGDVAFGFHAIVTDSLIRSAYGLRKGGDALANRFVKEIEAYGGSVLTKKRVTRINVVDRQARQVTCADGDAFAADWVISGIHPKATFALVDDQSIFPPAFTTRLSEMTESPALFGIYALTSDLGLNPLRNYYFFDDADPLNFLPKRAPGEVPSAAFISSARRETDPSRAEIPVNIHAHGPIEWFTPWQETKFAKRPQAYADFKNAYADKVFELVARYRPGFKESVKKHASSSPLTNLHFNGSEEGTAYGLYHSMKNTGPRALGPRTKVLNLLLTGQNCLFPGLLGAAISGLRTTGHIIGIKPTLVELRELGANS